MITNDTFQDNEHCPLMKVIQPGEFMMGSDTVEHPMYEDETPAQRVSIQTAFAIGVYPVTIGEMAVFAEDTDALSIQHRHFLTKRAAINPDLPAVMSSWQDARAFGQWLTSQVGRKYRLPREREWEYVCRAGTTTAYWWGDEFAASHANCKNPQIAQEFLGGIMHNVLDLDGEKIPLIPPSTFDASNLILAALTSVSAFPPNPWGLYDLLGNAWEWVEDWYEEQQRQPERWLPQPARSQAHFRCMRGGSWMTRPPRCVVPPVATLHPVPAIGLEDFGLHATLIDHRHEASSFGKACGGHCQTN